MTSYLILESSGENWFEVGTVEASGPKTAIRSILNGKTPSGERYCAIPLRSWHPVPVKTETKTTLRFY